MPQGKPRPDPVAIPRHALMRRFWRIFRLLAVFSIVIATIAVFLVTQGEDSINVHAMVATALGVGLTVLLGTALMTLVFLSAESGRDDAASPHVRKESEEE